MHAKAFPVMEHMAILKNTNSILYVIEALMNITQKNEMAAARSTHLETLEKEREKNMVEQYVVHNVNDDNKIKRNDISSLNFWKAINMNVLPTVL